MGWKKLAKKLAKMQRSLEGQVLAKGAAPFGTPAAPSSRVMLPEEADANELRRRGAEHESTLSLIKQAQQQPSLTEADAAFSAMLGPKLAGKLTKEHEAAEASTMDTSVGGRILKGPQAHVDRIDRLIKIQALEQDVAAKRENLAQARRGGGPLYIEKAEAELRAKVDALEKLQESAPAPAAELTGDQVSKAGRSGIHVPYGVDPVEFVTAAALEKLKKKAKGRSKLEKLAKKLKKAKKRAKRLDKLAKRTTASGEAEFARQRLSAAEPVDTISK